MNILDKIQKEKDTKNKEFDLFICEMCGKKMENNTFKSGSRLGGSYDCVCGNRLFF